MIGRATRLAQFYTRSDKIYEGVVRFGWSTDTYDRAGDADQRDRARSRSTRGNSKSLLEPFRGETLQTPPPVSAKKVGGKRAYELARQANACRTCSRCRCRSTNWRRSRWTARGCALRVHCSGGTYVRSIAHDLGRRMGCGAHIEELRRMASGEFEIAQARTIAQLESLAGSDGRLLDALVPAAKMLPAFPCVLVDDVTAGAHPAGTKLPGVALPYGGASGT